MNASKTLWYACSKHGLSTPRAETHDAESMRALSELLAKGLVECVEKVVTLKDNDGKEYQATIRTTFATPAGRDAFVKGY